MPQQEVSHSVKNENTRQALLNLVRDTLIPQRRSMLVLIRSIAKDLLVEENQKNILLKGYSATIAAELNDFCDIADEKRDMLDAKTLGALTEEKVSAGMKQALERIALTTTAVLLVSRVLEEFCKPNINQRTIQNKLKIIEKFATKIDDPQSVAKRKLAGALFTAGFALTVLLIVAGAIISAVFSPFATPVLVGLILGAMALGAAGVGAGIKGFYMRYDDNYRYKPLSAKLHFFRDVIKDGLAGKKASSRSEEYQMCRNMR